MTVINEFDEYDHLITVILVSAILVLNVGQFHETVRDNDHFSCELTIISVKITVILVYDNGHFGNYSLGIFGPHRTRTE